MARYSSSTHKSKECQKIWFSNKKQGKILSPVSNKR